MKKRKLRPLRKCAEKSIAEARKPLEALFAPFVDKLMKRFGCDAASLESILPYGGTALAGLLKQFAIDYALQYYRDVICMQKEVPARLPLMSKITKRRATHSVK